MRSLKNLLFSSLGLLLVLQIVHSQPRYNWVKPADLNTGLPNSIEIYTLRQSVSPFGTKLTGALLRFDPNDSNLEFVVKDTNGDQFGYFPKTP